VVVRVRVRPDGSVAEAELAQSSGSALLDESALRTVRESWRFVPARRDGTAVESWVEVPIRFVLETS
jgi:protein TonB